jgi:hypothetical protein
MRPRHAAEAKARDDAPIGEPLACDATAKVPHQESCVEILPLDPDRPALSPLAGRLEYRPKFASGVRQHVSMPALSG